MWGGWVCEGVVVVVGNVADRTDFNKMVITIVFLVRWAARYGVQKWIRRRDKATATGTERSTYINHPAAAGVVALEIGLGLSATF